MAHFAKIIDGIVEQVIVADSQEWCENNLGGIWVQTSYNTLGNKYLIEGATEEKSIPNPDFVDDGIPYVKEPSKPEFITVTVPKEPLHKNFAGIGYHWDGVGFYAPQPFPSWTKNEETYLWEAPFAYPTDGKVYTWNEADQKWDEVSFE